MTYCISEKVFHGDRQNMSDTGISSFTALTTSITLSCPLHPLMFLYVSLLPSRDTYKWAGWNFLTASITFCGLRQLESKVYLGWFSLNHSMIASASGWSKNSPPSNPTTVCCVIHLLRIISLMSLKERCSTGFCQIEQCLQRDWHFVVEYNINVLSTLCRGRNILLRYRTPFRI